MGPLPGRLLRTTAESSSVTSRLRQWLDLQSVAKCATRLARSPGDLAFLRLAPFDVMEPGVRQELGVRQTSTQLWDCGVNSTHPASRPPSAHQQLGSTSPGSGKQIQMCSIPQAQSPHNSRCCRVSAAAAL